ncbi:cadmium resistance transporter [Iningainema tapete]|uniref:Cadmium resistance transporter n=1 Tax=Iningainema tapete BLCC-T55 TaxID=2748662 RepID=A0A8J6XIL1_9CYAN|nr:cadmium resistance transporter [Iningainema tapete]MBD2777500.1 cadmium resistance transporter [Iningainema tapete BLCC-T55]
MSSLQTAIIESIISFIATNIDDILILLLFFSQVDVFRWRYIVIGQYLGFLAIVLASLPGFFGGLVVRQELIGLLGILPIVIGIKQLVDKEDEATEVQIVTSNFTQSSPSNPIVSFLLSILHPQVYKVAAVTLANGGDNIGIYIPLFAGNNLARLTVIIGVFFLMVGIWCLIAYFLARQASIASVLTRYGSSAVPFVLIALGVFILYERGTFNLLPWGKS